MKHTDIPGDIWNEMEDEFRDSPRMTNRRMQEKLETRDALDVRKMGREVRPGIFQLEYFLEDVDYCDAEKEEWIWSIGIENTTGHVFASTSTQFYLNPEFECVWLR